MSDARVGVQVWQETIAPYRVGVRVGDHAILLNVPDTLEMCERMAQAALEQAAAVHRGPEFGEQVDLLVEKVDLSKALQVIGLHAAALTKAAEELERRSDFTAAEWLRIVHDEARLTLANSGDEVLEAMTASLLAAIKIESPDELN